MIKCDHGKCAESAVHIVHHGSAKTHLCNHHMLALLNKRGALDLQTIKGTTITLPETARLKPKAENVQPPITDLTPLEELRMMYIQTRATLGAAAAGSQILNLCGAIISYLENQERERTSH